MSSVLRDAALILLFVIIGGVFAAAEMALVSLRESQVRQLGHRGTRGQTIARLTADPNRFLSAVQIGVTLAGFLSAAFGGATLAGPLGRQLQKLHLAPGVADTVALVLVTAAISYVSIVVGELTAKRLALQRSESFAMALAPLVDLIAKIARPVIWLLGVSTDGLVRLLGGDPKASREEVTSEELRAMVSGSENLGEQERQIVDDVFAAGTRSLREVMVPRTEVDFLDGAQPAYQAAREVSTGSRSRYPVTGDSADDILGFVHIRDLLNPAMSSRSVPVRELVRPVISLPDTVRVLLAMTELRRQGSHLAIVVDEYGGTAGIVTLEDLVEELIGDITDEYDEPAPEHGPEHDHEVDGLLSLEDFADRTGLQLPEGHYDTVAGFFVARLGRIPELDDEIETVINVDEADAERSGRVLLEMRVTELDGRRAARFWARMTPLPDEPDSDSSAEEHTAEQAVRDLAQDPDGVARDR
ncbi:HlyC/CorC family transporter [Microlunatus elymi]|uniref:HlyC/CorC family transporter n=1 Tax=Microlunatus elymi TaxID=2596828 RepID=A0A516PWV9_9ACTN|nr:hemolysin family protein [Microlunatus elymi]QDP95640.1 HlyC/CorC family transporter [Microlunatus elymi]